MTKPMLPVRESPVAPGHELEEHLLTVRQLADYMQMNERTILKLVNAGTLPGAKIASQWRFKRDVIDAWLSDQMHAEGEEVALGDEPDGAGMPLSDVMEERSIVAEMDAKDSIVAIEVLAARAFANGWLRDKPWFIGAVVEREALSSTAMDGGVAFLHTRSRNAAKINRPFIVVGRSHAGIDFGAPDGKKTHLFFLLGLKYDKLHLPILGRLARVLKRPEVVRTLRAAPTPSRMRDTLLQEDAKALQAAALAAAQAAVQAAAQAPAKKTKAKK
jgi:excisionase family DNA binding protein